MTRHPALEVEDVDLAFGGVQALSRMSLAVERGAISGLIGPNGAGKSTLFNVVSGIVRAQGGTVRLFGEDVSRLPVHEIALRGMVRTFQLARELGRLTVLDNVMLAARAQPGERLHAVFLRPSAVRRREQEVLARALDLLEVVGLSGVAGMPAASISGGQKKLLELARALMLEAEVILLDEPAAGVNPALMDQLAASIEEINRELKTTFLIIEHDMALVARLCSHVTVMGEGRRLAEGTFEHVTSDPRVVEAYLGGGDA